MAIDIKQYFHDDFPILPNGVVAMDLDTGILYIGFDGINIPLNLNTGETGPVGERGPRGYKGATGNTGATGATGKRR